MHHQLELYMRSMGRLSRPVDRHSQALVDNHTGVVQELVRDPNDHPLTTFLSIINGEVVYQDELGNPDGGAWRPMPTDDLLLRGVRMPTAAKPCGGFAELFAAVKALILRS